MKTYPLALLAQVLEARWIPAQNGRERFCGVSSDTRSLQAGELFCAIIGEKFDGHAFLDQAVAKGAAALMLSDPQAIARWEGKIPVLAVPETNRAYFQTAAWYRRQLRGHVIAVSGSVGKTGTRDFIYFALRKAAGALSKSVRRTEANLNNIFGIAQTILAAPEDLDYLVLEIGIDKPGEMEDLSALAQPNIAVVTNIGSSHLEQFQSRELLRDEKLAIRSHLMDGGLLIVNGDDALLGPWLQTEAARRFRAAGFRLAAVSLGRAREEEASGSENGPLSARSVCAWLEVRALHMTASGSDFALSYHRSGEAASSALAPGLPLVHLGRYGLHMVQNAAFACLCVLELGLDIALGAEGLQDYVETGRRLRRLDGAHMTVIDDSYNASPESCLAALDYLAVTSAAEGRRSVAALGCIAELGSESDAIHRALGRAAAAHAPAVLYICGPDAQAFAEAYLEIKPEALCRVFADREKLNAALMPLLQAGDILLVKGSHCYEMYKTAECAWNALEKQNSAV